MNNLVNMLKEDLDKVIYGEVIISEAEELNLGKVVRLTVKNPDSKISPSLKLTDNWIGALKEDYEKTKEEILHLLQDSMVNIPPFCTDVFSLDKIEEKLGISIVGVEQNKRKLQEIPHKIICDNLAVIYRIFFADGASSAVVTNNLLREMKITEEQLHSIAISNAVEKRPMKITSLNAMIQELTGMKIPYESDDDIIFVATTEDKNLGASVMAYPCFVDTVKEKFHSDMYVIPSSTHELILIPTSFDLSPMEIKRFIREVNITEVSAQDKLSDDLYLCDINEGCVKRVNLS